MSDPLEDLLDKITSRDAVVGVVGLGYVGLPVAVTFAEEGFRVVGVDLDAERVEAVEAGRSHLRDIGDDRIRPLRETERLRATNSYEGLATADAVLICVPTPLADGAPDLTRVVEAGTGLGKMIKPGVLVILESTTYPGTTEDILRPLLEAGGLTAGKDFFLAFSPERIDPGNKFYGFGDVPKVVGGVGAGSTKAATALYEQVVPKVVPVSGPKEAELAKLIENTFRHVNIALVNELAVYAHELGIDIWESIEAAATKPFGYMPFFPGPGWGGHCIPLDPTYLSWRVRKDRSHEVRFVELAHAVNSEMRRYVVERIAEILSDAGKPLRGARVMGLGVAYKAGTEDTRESPGIRVLDGLARRGALISYHDPLVPTLSVGGSELRSTHLDHNTLTSHDLIVVLVPQVGIDWDLVVDAGVLVFDCCNALKGRVAEGVIRL